MHYQVQYPSHHLSTAKRGKGPSTFPRSLLQTLPVSLTEEAENRLRQLVGLGQDRGAGLLQNLVLAQIRGFSGVVGVLDTATGGGDVFLNALQVADGVVEAVLRSTQTGAYFVDLRQGAVDDRNRVLGTIHRGNIDRTDGGLLGVDIGSANISSSRARYAETAEGRHAEVADYGYGIFSITGNLTKLDGVSGIGSTRLIKGSDRYDISSQSLTSTIVIDEEVGDLNVVAILAGQGQLAITLACISRDAGRRGLRIDHIRQGGKVCRIGNGGFNIDCRRIRTLKSEADHAGLGQPAQFSFGCCGCTDTRIGSNPIDGGCNIPGRSVNSNVCSGAFLPFWTSNHQSACGNSR